MNARENLRRKQVSELIGGVSNGGFSGLLKVMYLMPGINQPSIECIQEGESEMEAATSDEEYWDAALGMADCLKGFQFKSPEPDEPDNPGDTAADLVLAALIAHMHAQARPCQE